MQINRDYYRPIRRRRRGFFVRFWPLLALLALAIIFYETRPQWLFTQSLDPTPTPTVAALTYLSAANDAVRNGKFEAALAAYQQVALLEPQNPRPLIELSRLYLILEGLQTLSRSYDYAQRAVKLSPKDPDALNALARVLDWQGKFDEAASYAFDSLDFAPDNATTLAVLGEIYADLGNWERAQGYVTQALTIDPANVLALRNQAFLYERQGVYDAASQAYDKAIAAAPYHFDLYIEKARLLRIGLADFSGSIALLEKAVDIYEAPITLTALGEGLYTNGDHPRAIRILRKATEMDANFGTARIFLGMSLYARLNFEDAASELDRGLELVGPENARVEQLYTAGLAHVAKEPPECDKATPLFQIAIKKELEISGAISAPLLQGLRSCGLEYSSSGEIVK
jgi:tetratricopeptide (TPR) repeat protein